MIFSGVSVLFDERIKETPLIESHASYNLRRRNGNNSLYRPDNVPQIQFNHVIENARREYFQNVSQLARLDILTELIFHFSREVNTNSVIVAEIRNHTVEHRH